MTIAPMQSLAPGKEETFLTEDLPFAAYLQASRKRRFLTCQVSGVDRVAFVYADPNNEGDQLHLNFESGAECPAAAFYDSIRPAVLNPTTSSPEAVQSPAPSSPEKRGASYARRVMAHIAARGGKFLRD